MYLENAVVSQSERSLRAVDMQLFRPRFAVLLSPLGAFTSAWMRPHSVRQIHGSTRENLLSFTGVE
jgi:hypothetical protein